MPQCSLLHVNFSRFSTASVKKSWEKAMAWPWIKTSHAKLQAGEKSIKLSYYLHAPECQICHQPQDALHRWSSLWMQVWSKGQCRTHSSTEALWGDLYLYKPVRSRQSTTAVQNNSIQYDIRHNYYLEWSRWGRCRSLFWFWLHLQCALPYRFHLVESASRRQRALDE